MQRTAFLIGACLLALAQPVLAWSEPVTTGNWSDNKTAPAPGGAQKPPPPLWEPPRGPQPPATGGSANRSQGVGAACGAGGKIQVDYMGSWYAARALRGPDARGNCYVTYEGWSSSYDEWVSTSRVKLSGGGSASGGTPVSGGTSGGGSGAVGAACGGGGKVWVSYIGSWYAARALKGPDARGNCYVTYEGWSSSYDEWVGPSRLKLAEGRGNSGGGTSGGNTGGGASGGGAPVSGGNQGGGSVGSACGGGNKIWVSYIGSWYAARALKGPDARGNCYVTYEGWSSSYDEWVGPSRIQMAQGAGSGSGGQAPEAGGQTGGGSSGAGRGSGVAPGTYNCYTYDSGQLNYTYTDIVVRDGSRYAVGNSSGTYTMSGDRITFTGPLANSSGYYEIKNTGVPQIDLRFKGSSGGSMSCSKAR